MLYLILKITNIKIMVRNILLLSLLYLVSLGVVASAQAAATTLPKVKNVQVLEKDTTSITLTWNTVNKAKRYQVKVLNASRQKLKQVIAKKTKKKITEQHYG